MLTCDPFDYNYQALTVLRDRTTKTARVSANFHSCERLLTNRTTSKNTCVSVLRSGRGGRGGDGVEIMECSVRVTCVLQLRQNPESNANELTLLSFRQAGAAELFILGWVTPGRPRKRHMHELQMLYNVSLVAFKVSRAHH